jgi:hypothetical protein
LTQLRPAARGADDDAVQLALDTMIDSLRSICASNASLVK